MNIRHRFLMLTVAVYAVGATIVMVSPWRDHRHTDTANIPAVSPAAHGALAATSVDRAGFGHSTLPSVQAPIPTLAVVTVRPDPQDLPGRTTRHHASRSTPLLDSAGAASATLLSGGGMRMPYYSFGKTIRRQIRE